MALVSITEAAKLVRRNRSTLYRDIERGRLSKTVTPEGETQIETSELLRTYGRLHANDAEHGNAVDHDKVRIAILEERNRSLERALALEAELRKVKDQVTTELRARLADKDSVIKVLESKVLFLEYDRQVEALKPEPPASTPTPAETAAKAAPEPHQTMPEPRPEAWQERQEPPQTSAPKESPERHEPQQPKERQDLEGTQAPQTPPAPQAAQASHQAPEPVHVPEPEATISRPLAPDSQASPLADLPPKVDTSASMQATEPERKTMPEFAAPIYAQKSADPEIPSTRKTVMPRKSWWARLLHRR
ncbi:hypothetical protein ACFQUU_14150 [Herbaspirillum sp. GCM10030257]|uniref:hypothetical protein n=1 Tax=Herbaspirillum sp. GCM10030257 TaxID=3273393 RepID=UPI0036197816